MRKFALWGFCMFITIAWKPVAANFGATNLTAAKVTGDTSAASLKNYNRLFLTAFEQGYNYKAREYAAKALIIAIQRGNKREVAMANSNLAIINTRMGDYEKANENNFTALRIFRQLKDSLHIARCNLSIGTVFIKLKEYQKAIKYIDEAGFAFFKLNDQLGYSICLSNTGSIYMEMKDFRKALPIFFEALGIDEKNNDRAGISSNLANIGIVYLNIGNYEVSASYLKKALAIDENLGNISGIANVYLNLSKLMLETGKSDSALYYSNESLKKFHEAGQPDEKANVYSQYAKIYEQTGNYPKAFKYFVKASAVNDSILNVEKSARIAMLEEKYINEKLSNEILALEYNNALQANTIKNQRRLSITWFVGLLLSIIAGLIILIQLRRKNEAYKFIVSKNIDLIKKEKELHLLKSEMESIRLSASVTSNIPTSVMHAETPSPDFQVDEKTRLTIPEEEKKKLLEKLRHALQHDKIYTRLDLTIEKLARKLSTNRTYLSQLINDEYHKNYSELINEYRIREAMSLLSDQVLADRYSIEAIAKEAGFNNISTFNSLFRKHVGITPSIFRKNAHSQ